MWPAVGFEFDMLVLNSTRHLIESHQSLQRLVNAIIWILRTAVTEKREKQKAKT